MKPDISEFSYGYALTEALIWDTGLPVIGAPLFPSLIEEGQSGGYDVAISFSGLLMFLQFKLAHFMKRGTAFESKIGLLNVPFYRMHLRPARHSRQHRLLLDLEATGELVYYTAPKFHLPSELNRAYLNRTLIHQSFFIRPSTIGHLPDDGDHHVSFRDGYPVYLCSEPRKIREIEHRETSLKELSGVITDVEYKKYDEVVLAKLNDKILSLVLKHQISRHPFSPDNISKLRDMNAVEKLRYLSRTFFDSEPIVIKARNIEE
jgi:hypothetical protein